GAMMAATAAYAAAVLGMVFLWSRTASVRACMTKTPAAARYRRRMMIASAVYVATLLLAVGIYARHPQPGPLSYALAIAPGLAVAGMFVVMGLYLREEGDEFERTVQVESSLWATGVVMMGSAVWGFLELFRLAPHVQLWLLVPIWS